MLRKDMNLDDFTDREQSVLILSDFGVEQFKELAMKINPELFKKWNGNCCRQAAVIAKHTFEGFLPEYQTDIWEGHFEMNTGSAFDHAWLFAKSPEGKRIIVDVTGIMGGENNEDFAIFEIVPSNKIPFNKFEHIRKHGLKEISRKRLNYDEMLEQKEYFTGIKGKELLEEIEWEIEKYIVGKVISAAIPKKLQGDFYGTKQR